MRNLFLGSATLAIAAIMAYSLWQTPVDWERDATGIVALLVVIAISAGWGVWRIVCGVREMLELEEGK
jgi:hypothetical protein